MFKEKLKALLVHFTISAFIVTLVVSFVITVWYPEPFFEISGLKNILVLLISVDLVLGPLLTFVVFKPKKKTLKFDLAVIAVVQIVALCYGTVSIYQAHPLYVVYHDNKFTPVSVNEIATSRIKHDELKKSSLTGPTLVYAELPSNPSEAIQLALESITGASTIEFHSEYYVPFDKFSQEVLAHGLKPEVLLETPEHKQKLEQFLAKHGKTANDYAFLPLVGKELDVLWVWSRESGKPVGTLDINPWQQAQVATAQ